MSRVLTAIAFTLLLPASAFAENPATGAARLAKADERFLNEASQGNAAEVALGELARDKAQNPEVKKFAQMMIDHHNQANQQLSTLVKDQQINLSTEPAAKHVALKTKLGNTPAEQFDARYIKAMVEEHKKTQMLYENQAKKSKNTVVTEYIKEQLPIVQQHLNEAIALQKQLAPTPQKK